MVCKMTPDSVPKNSASIANRVVFVKFVQFTEWDSIFKLKQPTTRSYRGSLTEQTHHKIESVLRRLNLGQPWPFLSLKTSHSVACTSVPP